MKIKDFTVGQVVYAFDDLNLIQAGRHKGKPRKYTVAKIGRKYLYAARGEIKDIKTVPNYLLTDFREPEYTDEFLEINADYGRITILFPDMETADKFFEKKRLANLLKTEVKWEDYSLDKLQEVQKNLGGMRMTALQQIFQGYYESRIESDDPDPERMAVTYKKVTGTLNELQIGHSGIDEIMLGVSQYGAAAEETGFYAGFKMAWELLKNMQEGTE